MEPVGIQPERAARRAWGRGQGPALHFFLSISAENSWCGKFRVWGAPSRFIGASIPDRSPGHAFVPMTT